MEHFRAVLIWGQGWEGEFWLFKGCTENTVNITLWKVKWYSGLKMLEVHLDKFVCTFLHVCIFVYVYLLNVRVWRGGGVSVGLLVDLQFNIRSAIVSSSLGKLDGSIYCIYIIYWKLDICTGSNNTDVVFLSTKESINALMEADEASQALSPQ